MIFASMKLIFINVQLKIEKKKKEKTFHTYDKYYILKIYRYPGKNPSLRFREEREREREPV